MYNTSLPVTNGTTLCEFMTQLRASCVFLLYFTFTSLHFLKAPQTGQRTRHSPAALSALTRLTDVTARA